MRSLTLSLLIGISSTLMGCATTGVNNFSPSSAPNASTVKASWHRESMAVWEGFDFTVVDGKFVRPGFLADPGDAVLKIDPGQRNFVVFAKFNRGVRTGPYQAYMRMRATLKPSTTYQLMGKVEDMEVVVWLEEEGTKERVSELASAPWSKTPDSPAPIPIYIPAR